MLASLRAAEEQTELAYLGAIKALAAALDARDPYTAGHSERVSALSVMLGEQLGLAAEELEVIRDFMRGAAELSDEYATELRAQATADSRGTGETS